MSLTQTLEQKLNTWLTLLIEAEGADLHIKSDSQIRARVKSDIVLLSKEKIDAKTIEALVKMLIGDGYDKFREEKSVVPRPDTILKTDDILILVGEEKNIERLKSDCLNQR